MSLFQTVSSLRSFFLHSIVRRPFLNLPPISFSRPYGRQAVWLHGSLVSGPLGVFRAEIRSMCKRRRRHFAQQTNGHFGSIPDRQCSAESSIVGPCHGCSVTAQSLIQSIIIATLSNFIYINFNFQLKTVKDKK